MNYKFVQTNNVNELKDAIQDLEERDIEVPGLGITYGQAGLGKTKTAIWYAAANGAIYVRAKRAWSCLWMLQEICIAMKHYPYGTTSKVFAHLKSEFTERPRTIFIDEADYLCKESRILDSMRDLLDECPRLSIMLIGMDISKKLITRPQFWSRVTQVVEFKPLMVNEIILLSRELIGYDMDNEAAANLHKYVSGDFRDAIVALAYLERQAKSTKTEKIGVAMADMAIKNMLKRKVA